MCCGTQTGEQHTTEGRWWRCEAGQAGRPASCQVSQCVHISFAVIVPRYRQHEAMFGHKKPCAVRVPTD
jgi:hypothetical protein